MHRNSVSIIAQIVVIISLCTASLISKGQDMATSDLVWTVNKSHDLTAKEDYDYQCTFRTNGIHPIIWSQNHDELMLTLEIGNVSGSWTDVSKDGSVTYQITVSGLQGSLTFERVGTTISIQLNLDANPDAFVQRYDVVSIQNN